MLTTQNYFDKDNGVLTRSKIMDYLLCPNYFKRKWLDGEIEEKPKKAFATGKAVDDLLAQMDNVGSYAVLEVPDDVPEDKKATYWMTKAGRELKKELADSGKTILTQAEYDNIIAIADAVSKTTAYKELKDFEKQRVLEVKQKIGSHFNSIAGLPDFIKEYDDKIVITDLKTSQTIDSRKYYWHCRSYGYYLQAAIYVYLAKKCIADKPVEFYHLVAEKAEPYRVKTFKMRQNTIDEYEKVFLNTVQEISTDNFNKLDCSLQSAELLGDNSEDWEDDGE